MKPATQAALTQLINCVPLTNTTPNISVVVLLDQDHVPNELRGCILGPGIAWEQEHFDFPGGDTNSIQESDGTEGKVTNDEMVSNEGSCDKLVNCDDNPEEVVILKWVRNYVHGGNLQIIEVSNCQHKLPVISDYLIGRFPASKFLAFVHIDSYP